MILKNLLKESFSKTKNYSQIFKQLDIKVQQIRKQYNELRKGTLDANVHAKLISKAEEIDDITNKRKRMKIEQQKEQQLNIVKEYLDSKVIQPKKKQQNRYIPAGLTLNKLEYKNHSVLLVGIDKHNQEHGLFVQDLTNRMNIQLLMLQLPSDWPYFIKTTEPFSSSWKKFITRSSQYSFYLNPKPQTLSQIMLDRNKIPLFKQTLLKSDNFEEQTGVCLQLNTKTNNFQTNSFLNGLFCLKLENIICFDYPILRQRQYQALTMSIETLRQLFNKYLYTMEQANENSKNFDPRLLHYQKMLKPKIQYMTRVIKLGSLMHSKTIAVCDYQYSHFICDQWKNPLPQNNQIFNFPGQAQLIGSKKRGFLEHLQKLIILDLIISPVMSQYFIKHKVFPYSCNGFIGKDETMNALNIIWDFYKKKYTDALKFSNPIENPTQRQNF